MDKSVGTPGYQNPAPIHSNEGRSPGAYAKCFFTPRCYCVRPQMIVSGSNNTAASTPAAAVPFVKTFGYNNYTQGPNKRITKCSVCGIKIKDAVSTTSNVIRHLKMHPDRSVTW